MVGWCSMGTFNDPCWFCQFEHVIFENVPRHDVVHQQWSGATDDGLVGSLSPGQTWNMGSWQMKVMSQQKAGMFASTGCSKISKYNIIYIYTYIYYILKLISLNHLWFVVQLTKSKFHSEEQTCLPVPDSQECLGRFWGKMLPVPGAPSHVPPWSMAWKIHHEPLGKPVISIAWVYRCVQKAIAHGYPNSMRIHSQGNGLASKCAQCGAGQLYSDDPRGAAVFFICFLGERSWIMDII